MDKCIAFVKPLQALKHRIQLFQIMTLKAESYPTGPKQVRTNRAAQAQALKTVPTLPAFICRVVKMNLSLSLVE